MAMVITDPNLPDNPIVFANDAFLDLTGYPREEVNGRNCRFLQGPESDPATVREIGAALRAFEDVSVDILNYRKDGSTFWNALFIGPVFNAQRQVQYFFASQLDVTSRKLSEIQARDLKRELEIQVMERTAELEISLKSARLLLHEVDHRVKNNLQMISAMLMLQSLSIPDEKIQKTLQSMLERVEAMGLVHKTLYQSTDITSFDIGEFTREIASNLVAASGREDIELKTEIEQVMVKADHAASLAIIINETITNALKHGLPSGREGVLSVQVKALDQACEISVEDNGNGLGKSTSSGTGFGNTLILTLSKQLRASVEWLSASPGTRVRVMMPISA